MINISPEEWINLWGAHNSWNVTSSSPCSWICSYKPVYGEKITPLSSFRQSDSRCAFFFVKVRDFCVTENYPKEVTCIQKENPSDLAVDSAFFLKLRKLKGVRILNQAAFKKNINLTWHLWPHFSLFYILVISQYRSGIFKGKRSSSACRLEVTEI